MEKRDIFIGGAWPYANYYLHVGHLAALLPGDIIAKYYRECKDNVIYVSGSDCHGTPITERARKDKIAPKDIAEYYHNEFIKTFDKLGFEYDLYTATMSEDHKKYIEEFFKKIKENGYLFEKEGDEDYCIHCNKFLSDREIIGICPHCGGTSTGDQCEVCGTSLDSKDLLDKHCKICSNPTTLRKNKHLYFKLPEFKEELQNLINKNKDKWRKNAIGEAQKYIDMGLVNRAATRQLDWGVKVPVEGYIDKRIYVWLEAVLGYLSAGEKVAKDKNIDFDLFMDDNNKNLTTYYVHGKDNIPFHTTIYPPLILASKKNYRLPDYIVSSAYVNLNNDKMSKSKGNLITANELVEKFDSDTIRFYFSYKGPETNDMNCSMEDIIQTHNKFLVGMLGNFVNRNLSFINKKFDGVIKESTVDEETVNITKEVYKSVAESFEKAEIRNAVQKIVDYISYANKYYDSNEPWLRVKDNIDEFNKITYTCIYIMANLANLIYPILPKASKKIKTMLSFEDLKWEEEKLSGDYHIKNLDILYNRIEEKILK